MNPSSVPSSPPTPSSCQGAPTTDRHFLPPPLTLSLSLRLWTSKASCEFDLGSFNDGQYYAAIEEKERSEPLTSVLYPCDNNSEGKELRLRQQYFYVSATLQDILRRYKKRPRPWVDLPAKVAIQVKIRSDPIVLSPNGYPRPKSRNVLTPRTIIRCMTLQLNETHPAIAIPEFMRLLLDEERLAWSDAWRIVHDTCAYTNHTVMPEALEVWPLPLFEKMLPRHLKIIYDINHQFLTEVRERWPNDPERVKRMSIIEESEPKLIRMAHLAIIGCHKVLTPRHHHTTPSPPPSLENLNPPLTNISLLPLHFSQQVNGVAQIHTSLLCTSLFPDFAEMWPNKFVNVTNGINHRRWMLQVSLITSSSWDHPPHSSSILPPPF